MKAQANTGRIRYISQEIKDVSWRLGGVSSEIEDVVKELRKQTSFAGLVRKLRKDGEKLIEEMDKTRILAQALADIGELYEKTEVVIEGHFTTDDKILYGGEKNGSRTQIRD